MHSEESRHYHSLCHLEEMFSYIDLALESTTASIETSSLDNGKSAKKKENSVWKAILDLSVFFHDAVYNAKSSTNEEDSAILFQSFVTDFHLTTDEKCDCWIAQTVKRFILATKSHNVDNLDLAETEEMYLHLFLDADMSVLGKDPQAYDHYASLIRYEYVHVPEQIYCEKRAEILRSFIGSVKKDTGTGGEGSTTCPASKTVYLNESLRDALEDRAICNLQREIESLEKGIIPQ